MNLHCLLRTVVPPAGAVLCGVLASCSSGSGSPDAGPTPAHGTPTARVKTVPPSRLCTALDAPAARKISAKLRYIPRVSPNKDEAADACDYGSGDGTVVLGLAPATRSYGVELTLARGLVGDPGPAGMRNVRVKEVGGLGQAAFSETGYLVQQRQYITFVVWRSGSRAWVINLSEAGRANGGSRAVALARQITARLPR